MSMIIWLRKQFPTLGTKILSMVKKIKNVYFSLISLKCINLMWVESIFLKTNHPKVNSRDFHVILTAHKRWRTSLSCAGVMMHIATG